MNDEIVVESGSAKFARILAIVIFSVTMGSLGFAIISDAVIFAQQIIAFIFACFASAFAFLAGFILMVFSFVLVFGFFLAEQYGFWPATWATSTFKEIMADNMPTKEQVSAMTIIRILLIIICLIVFILSIVCLSMNKRARKNNVAVKFKRTRSFGTVSLIFSLLGIFMGLAFLLVLSLL